MFARKIVLIVSLLIGCQCLAQASGDTSKPYRVAVFAPLYLDSLFEDYSYKFSSDQVPRFATRGLEFYNGVMLAVDQLKEEGIKNMEVFIYDTKKDGGLLKLLSGLTDKGFSMMIAVIENPTEQKILSGFSLQQNTPMVSATYPNEIGLANNPFFIMLNATLKTHVEALPAYVQRYKKANVVYVSRNGSTEQMITNYFKQSAAKQQSFKYKPVVLKDNFSFTDLAKNLDTTVQNVIITGSLNDNFSVRLVKALDTSSAYRNKVVAVGMPTWEHIKTFQRKEIKHVPIVHSASSHFDNSSTWAYKINKSYHEKFLTKASENVLAGFETMYRFSKIMLKNPVDMVNHISDKSYNVWNAFTFEPARVDANESTPDFMENKKLYYITRQNGVTKSVY